MRIWCPAHSPAECLTRAQARPLAIQIHRHTFQSAAAHGAVLCLWCRAIHRRDKTPNTTPQNEKKKKRLSGTAVSPKDLSPPSTGIFWTFEPFPRTTSRLPSRRAMSYITPPVIVQHKLTQQIMKPIEQKRRPLEQKLWRGALILQNGNVGSFDCTMENQVAERAAKANQPHNPSAVGPITERLVDDNRSWNCDALLQLPYYAALTYAKVIRRTITSCWWCTGVPTSLNFYHQDLLYFIKY